MAKEKNIQKNTTNPELAKRIFKIFCIVLGLFGVFAAYFGISSLLNASGEIAAASEAAAAAGKDAVSMSAVWFSIWTAFVAVAGVAKVFLGVCGVADSKKKLAKIVNTVNIVNLALVLIALIALSKMGTKFLVVGIVDLVLAVAALIWFSEKLVRYFREMFGELKKLTWLTGRELASHTFAVFVFVIGMALVIYLLDLAFSAGFNLLERINIG